MNDNNPPKSATTVDVLTWLCRATLDVIGEAGTSLLMLLSHALISVSGFGYSFHSLATPGTEPSNADKTDNELARAFATMFSPQHQFSKLTILAIWFPFLKRLVRVTLLNYGLPRILKHWSSALNPLLSKKLKPP